MPQMSPMIWLILYFYLMVILLLMNIILNYLNMFKIKDMKMNYKKFNYKWYW